MVGLSESVGLTGVRGSTKVRLSRKSTTRRLSTTMDVSPPHQIPVHLSPDDMSRVLDRDQRTVFAPFNKDNSQEYVKSRLSGAATPTDAPLPASACKRATGVGNSSRCMTHPDESASSSRLLSSSSLISSSSTLSSTSIRDKSISTDFTLQPNSSQSTSHPPHSTTSCSSRSSSFRSKLLSVLTVSACVLSLVNLPYTTAAPMTDRELELLKADKPFWQNPCELSTSYSSSSENSEDMSAYQGIPVSNQQLIGSIDLMSQQAMDHYKTFLNHYVSETFSSNPADHIKAWKNEGYPWLPRKDQIPKNLNESLPKDYKNELELEKALLDSYEYLQKVAVGMETVATDHHNRDSEFKDHFHKSIGHLRTVLCEVQSVIMNCKIQMRDDVQRDIMPDEVRNFNDETNRHVRDWLIFRDYMNVMEYVHEVFHHLSENMQ